MNSINNKIIILGFICVFLSCNLDYKNPNALTEKDLYTKQTLSYLAIGIKREYATNALNSLIFMPSLTTQETSLILTNSAAQPIEEGGDKIFDNNGRIKSLFFSLTKTKGMAELLIKNSEKLEGDESFKKILIAYGSLFRAICIGGLIHNFEKIPLVNSLENDTEYVDRGVALNEAVTILEEALENIEKNEEEIVFGINLKNTIYAYLSRYTVMLGEYDKAIAYGKKVDLTKKSVFEFDNQSRNPLYLGLTLDSEFRFYASKSNFGLSNELIPEAMDKRVQFYLSDELDSTNNNIKDGIRDGKSELTGKFVKKNKSPFAQEVNSEIPVYLPGEVLLNIAEAYAKKKNLTDAVEYVNKVRTKTNDIFGINAELPMYSGSMDIESVLNEIYKNRRIELHLTGLSLEDSRRFRPTNERTRNYYPYPYAERINNKNTPSNPKF